MQRLIALVPYYSISAFGFIDLEAFGLIHLREQELTLSRRHMDVSWSEETLV